MTTTDGLRQQFATAVGPVAVAAAAAAAAAARCTGVMSDDVMPIIRRYKRCDCCRCRRCTTAGSCLLNLHWTALSG